MGTAASLRSLPPSSGRHRSRLTFAALAMMGGRVVAAACGFIQVPIVLAHLGTAGLGIWIALVGWLWSASILDFGIGFAVQNRLAMHLAKQSPDVASAVVRKGLQWLTLLGVVFGVIGLTLAWLGNWPVWLGATTPELQSHVRPSVAIVMLAAAIMLPLSLGTRIAAAHQETWITGVWTTACSVLGLSAVYLAAQVGASLMGFVAAACILPIGPHIAAWFHIAKRIGNPPGRMDAPAMEGISRESLFFFMPQLAATFMGALVPTLVAVICGPIAAATFGVLQRLFGFGLQIHALGLAPAWPAYTHAVAVGDAQFARRTLRTTAVITITCFILPTLVLTPLVPTLLQLWLGPGAPSVAPMLLWAMAAWTVAQFCGQPIAAFLNGIGRMESIAAVAWSSIAVTLAGSAILGPRIGILGIVISLIAPYIAINLPVTFRQARHGLTAMAQPANTDA